MPEEKGPQSYRLDFSRISPRQLKVLLDELLTSGNPDDWEVGSDISMMLPCGLSYDDDTPMNLTADIEGARDWNRKYGEATLADRLDSLLGRMKVLEMRYTRISETA